MKKTLFIAGILLLMVCVAGCRSRNAKTTVGDGSSAAQEPETRGGDAHNARNSLDVDGLYVGSEFEWNGYSVRRIISLSGEEYERGIWTVEGNEHDPLEFEAGPIVWNEEGNTLTLEFAMGDNRYFVGENILITLDNKGRKTKDESLILKKQIPSQE